MSSSITALLHSKLGTPSQDKAYPWLGAPKLGIVCGSGLALLEEILEDKVEIHIPILTTFPRLQLWDIDLVLLSDTLRSEGGERFPVICQLGR
ncbi:hypothetical protein BT69DRAFT_1336132 [Atractiella rhizophila]|nr:hypothetical protein BT69DRAFT_1336132 [Atractiella rhizophila]